MECIETVTNRDPSVQQGYKVFNDPIHGHIELHPLCVKIIDTPQFQRLRFLKQLGELYFVYPGASHNRFEHCLGVCYLAGRLVSRIKHMQPDLEITDKEVLCVQIAGLCRDLGHGPFSHVFNKFIPAVCSDSKWKREDASVMMFDHMVTENDLGCEFEKYKIDGDMRTFIKDLIECKPEKNRDERKGFFNEIICNKRNGIDADRWDYIARDCLLLGIRSNFDHKRCIKYVRVIKGHNPVTEPQLCFRDKESGDFYDMFYLRAKLHRQAYQHKTTYIISEMILQALIKADEHLQFEGQGGRLKKMSQAVDDMKVLSKLTDDVYNVILNSTKPELRESREILRIVLTRELPKCVDEKPLPDNVDDDKKTIETIERHMNIPRTEYIIQVANLDFGMKKETPRSTQETDPTNNQETDPINNQETNPIKQLLFYSKHNPDVPRAEQTQLFLPVRYKEKLVRVFSTKKDHQSREQVKQAFGQSMEEMARERPADEGTNERTNERNPQDVTGQNIAVISHRGLVSQIHFKVFNDPVHGHISMHPLCVLIIDTPEFQRLRRIKQINAAYFVYPGASHNRFEHSLGVCYLAGKVVKKLKKQKQPDLEITDADVLCVQIAGLCTDLGQGPFSYLFEERFLPQMQQNCTWKHKEASVKLFCHLIEKNKLIDTFKMYGLENADITFIKELLNVKAEQQDPEWKYTGRDESKRFLYEIVTNVRNGIDADTWDSCARDCLMLGMSSRFDHMRCIKYVRAIKVHNKYQICFRDKEKRDFDELFFILAKLKDMAYQHKTTFIAGEMIVEALMKANALILFEGTHRKDLTILEASEDMGAFCALTDDLITQILNFPYPKLKELEDLRSTQEPNQQRLFELEQEETKWKEARRVLENVLKRKFYKFVSEIKLPRLAKFENILERTIAESGLTKNDIVCQFVELDYAPNVCNKVAFYSKHNPEFATVEQGRGSQSYSKETIVRVFCKKENDFGRLKEKLDLLTDMVNDLPLSFAETTPERH